MGAVNSSKNLGCYVAAASKGCCQLPYYFNLHIHLLQWHIREMACC